MSKFFSLAYLTLPNTHPVDQIEIAAQCGYEGVGLRTISQHLPGEPDYALANGRMFQMVRAALERTGVTVILLSSLDKTRRGIRCRSPSPCDAQSP